MLARAALGGIWIYQRYISPYKGFRCAHAVLHGGSGCSGFAKDALRAQGFLAAIPLVRQRFRDCRLAYDTLCGKRDETWGKRTKRAGRQLRDACCDEVLSQTCGACFDGTTRSAPHCIPDCDICSCG